MHRLFYSRTTHSFAKKYWNTKNKQTQWKPFFFSPKWITVYFNRRAWRERESERWGGMYTSVACTRSAVENERTSWSSRVKCGGTSSAHWETGTGKMKILHNDQTMCFYDNSPGSRRQNNVSFWGSKSSPPLFCAFFRTQETERESLEPTIMRKNTRWKINKQKTVISSQWQFNNKRKYAIVVKPWLCAGGILASGTNRD